MINIEETDMPMSRRAVGSALCGAMLAAGAPALRAHESDSGPNGGPMVEVKGLHLELIAKGTDLVVVLSDASHAPVESKGASGRAVVLEAGAQRTVPLAPVAPDRLAARLESPLAGGARVVVSAKLATGQDLLARFVLK